RGEEVGGGQEVGVTGGGRGLARGVGDGRWVSPFLAGPIGALERLGRWDDALERTAEAEGLATTEFARSLTLTAVPIHCNRGALDEARERLARLAGVAQSENPEIAGSYAVAAAQLARAEGRGEEAFAMVKRIFEAQERADWVPSWLLFDAFETVILVSEPERIRSLLTLLDDRPSPLSSSVLAQPPRFPARLPEHAAAAAFATAPRRFREREAPFPLSATR